MTKFKTILLIGLIIASVAASLMIHARAETASEKNAALLQQQTQQLANLQAEQQRLSQLTTHAADMPTMDRAAELAKLRAQAEALRKQTNDLAQQSKKLLTSPPSPSVSKEKIYPPEYWEQMEQIKGRKGEDALYLASALWEYAMDHQHQYPSNLDQAAPYLAKAHETLSGTNQFEIVFHGSIDQLDGLPNATVAGIRETQTWLSPDGRPTRVYGMIPGMGQTISSDDNFQSWETEHVIFSSAGSAK